MRKFLPFFLCLLMVFSMSACGGGNEPKESDNSNEPEVIEVDEDAAIDFFDELIDSYPLGMLTYADPDYDFEEGISPYWYAMLTNPETDSMGSDIDEVYISDQERAYIEDESYYEIYSMDALQDSVDSIWGKDRTNVKRWTVEDLGLISKKGYFILCPGFGDNGDFYMVEKDSFRTEGNAGIVSAYCLIYNYFDQTLVDASRGGEALASDLDIPDDSDFDSVLKATGIRKKDLGTMDFVFYNTEDGIRLWAVGPEGATSMPE